MTLHIHKTDLVKAVGKGFRGILRSLIKEGCIKGYVDSISVVIDKEKAIHFQSALAFHSVKDVPEGPLKHHYQKDE